MPALPPSEAKVWQMKNPEAFAGLDYRHESLTRQLDGGVRQIELDIFADSQGGRFAHPDGAAHGGRGATSARSAVRPRGR